MIKGNAQRTEQGPVLQNRQFIFLKYIVFSNGIVNAPECIVELYKQAGIPQASLGTSLVFLKIPKCLYNSTMHESSIVNGGFGILYQ